MSAQAETLEKFKKGLDFLESFRYNTTAMTGTFSSVGRAFA